MVTHGPGSLDLYSERIAEHLPVALLHTDVYQRSARRFGVRPLAPGALRQALADRRFVAELRRLRGPVHLPNQHLGRYGLHLAWPYVVTVHDTIRLRDTERREPLIQPLTSRDRRRLRRDLAGARGAVGLVVPSNATRREVIARLGVPAERVVVVHNGIDHALFRPVRRRLFAFPYVLFVGSEQPRKDLPTLLRAFARLVQRPGLGDLRLVKVGDAGGPAFRRATQRCVAALDLRERVVFTDRLRPADLVATYSGAACLALPSRSEGFGLPPIEAMACGCPVVVSRAGALPEVVDDAALLVAPGDVDTLADALAQVLLGGAAPELIARGLRRARHFSWPRAASETLEAYGRFGLAS